MRESPTTTGTEFDSQHATNWIIHCSFGMSKSFHLLPAKSLTGGQDRDGDDVTRLLGQGGVRASLPFTKINPGVQSKLLNLNGLAHKINLESELMFADANRDLARFPLYDPLQDDSIEASLRRAILFNFGGTLPVTSDDRFYALRSGMQSWVASPSTEIAGGPDNAQNGCAPAMANETRT